MFDPILVPFREFASRDPDVVALLLFGSVARGDATARSDVDVAFVARPGRARTVDHRLAEATSTAYPTQVSDPNHPKRVLFPSDLSCRVEAFVVEDVRAVHRYLVGSRLEDPAAAIVLDREGTPRSAAPRTRARARRIHRRDRPAAPAVPARLRARLGVPRRE